MRTHDFCVVLQTLHIVHTLLLLLLYNKTYDLTNLQDMYAYFNAYLSLLQYKTGWCVHVYYIMYFKITF